MKTQRHQNGKHKQSHSNTVVVALQSKLATMSNDFKSVLEVRTEVCLCAILYGIYISIDVWAKYFCLFYDLGLSKLMYI